MDAASCLPNELIVMLDKCVDSAGEAGKPFRFWMTVGLVVRFRVLVDFMAGITHRGVILGLDIGDARIGVAISDELGIAAHPLCTITRKNRKVDLAALHALIDTHRVEQIVIGLPLRLNGEIGIQAQKVQKFAAVLERTSNLPISFWDERFTTIEAEQILQETKKRRKKRKRIIDQVAAVLILDGYLEQSQNRL